MKLKELTDYNEYVQHQSERSGMLTSANSVINDLKKSNIVLPESSFILDIGCRAGAVVIFEFMKLGYDNAYGIDIGYDAEEYWKQFVILYNRKLKRGDIHDGIPFEHKWDFITISHTLEHCFDPNKVVTIIHDSLNENGYVHSIIPIEESYEHFNRHKPHMAMFESHDDHQQFYIEHGFEIVYQSLEKNNSILIAKKK